MAGLDMNAINSCPAKTIVRALLLFALASIANIRANISTSDACVELTATWSESPNQITLNWQADTNATGYKISRKLLGESSWNVVTNLDGASTNWSDTAITTGFAYEYQAIKSTTGSYAGYGYICTGIKRGAPENRGKVILLVTKELADGLPIELLRLVQDLVGDGWAVLQHTVATTQSVTSVKDLIRADYNADPSQTKALFLFGHVPVPYSGNFSPDGHEDSVGAWPADVFYGDMDGAWTDLSVSNKVYRFENVPGDGRYDQNVPPGQVRLQIGRVDLSNLTCFANKTPARYEIDLARQYLNKDHSWRHGKLPIQRRALIFDRFYAGPEPEPQTSTAYRHFPAFFGRTQIRQIGAYEYFPILSTNSYLWTFTTSGGSAYGSDYIGTSDNFATEQPQAVFTSFLGSYFANWNQESDFLRAPLGASGSILTVIFAGQPQWLLHTMAMGEPIGYSAWMTQNNKTNGLYPPQLNAGAGCVHIALMGDPTVRMHPALPPGALSGTVDSSGVHLSWTAPADPDLRGYNVYKATSPTGPFTKISGGNLVTTTHFDDPSGTSQNVYMVRALKLETSPSGSYFNLSQGVFYPDSLNGSSAAPDAPTAVSASKITPGKVTVEWLASSIGVRAFQVQRRVYPNGSFQIIGESPSTSTSFEDTNIVSGSYAYRVKALGTSADSSFSDETVLNLTPPTGRVIRVDKQTSGNWIGQYGSEGYMVAAAATNWPAYVSVTASNLLVNVYGWYMTEPELLLRPDASSRILSFWAGAQREPLGLNFRFKDSALHRVALYMVDYQSTRHQGVAQVIDPFSGQVMTSLNFSNYTFGQYLVFDLQNYANIRLVPADGDMGTSISGIFFDPPILTPPIISPASGNFLGKTTVTMQSDLGATIRYTLDGQPPTANSPTYSGPFVLDHSATIMAQATSGPVETAVTQVNLTNTLFSAASFVGIDATTQGDWMKSFGQDGQWIADWTSKAPAYADLTVNGAPTWVWSDTTTELRAFNKYARVAGRIAAAWYDSQQLLIDLMVASTDLHPVALYFMDWDGGRVEDVFLSDDHGNVLDHQRVSDFSQGKYLVWNLKGKIRVTIQHVSGPNAVLNGVFVGGGSPISQDPPTFDTTATFSNGSYTMHINGQPGQEFYIQSSPDFSVWADIGRVTITSASADFSIPVPPEEGTKFFRARLVQ